MYDIGNRANSDYDNYINDNTNNNEYDDNDYYCSYNSGNDYDKIDESNNDDIPLKIMIRIMVIIIAIM